MKALVYTGPKQLVYRDADDPAASESQALVKIESVGICGSDMHAYLGHDERRPAPLILGHEAAGTVIGGPMDGKRVTINPLVNCGQCQGCLEGRGNLCRSRKILSMPPAEGTFAEYVAIRTENLVEVPTGVSLSKASLAEPLACGWHAVKLAANAMVPSPKEASTLVLGGGAIGVGAALSLKAQGFGEVVVLEPHAGRRAYVAERIGLNCIEAAALRDLAQFDVVIDAVGFSATRRDASQFVKPGGVIAHIGLGEAEGGLDIRRMTLQEITFIGTYTYTMKDFKETAGAIFDGRFGALDWMEHRALCDGADAFADLLAGKVNAPKIILHPAAG